MKILKKLFEKTPENKEEHDLVLNRLSEVSGRIEKEVEMKKLWFDDEGMTSIEYAMTVVFIACVAILGFELLGGSVKSLFDMANTLLPK